ncbi:MAG: hypothetical protein FVQ83_06600 [Chloroflexi bacterium]|nr:hypothetical protein [Chloroflexota bacterium]
MDQDAAKTDNSIAANIIQAPIMLVMDREINKKLFSSASDVSNTALMTVIMKVPPRTTRNKKRNFDFSNLYLFWYLGLLTNASPRSFGFWTKLYSQ